MGDTGKRYTAEQIVNKLREAEVELSKGQTIPVVAKKLGITPLRRWLRKAVGRGWNDVHSEICRSLDRRSTVQRHVLVHVDGYVNRHVLMINGVPHMRMGLRPPIELWDGRLFVDPRNGLLCQHKQLN